MKASDLSSVKMHICYESNLEQYAYTSVDIDKHHIIISLVIGKLTRGAQQKLLAEVLEVTFRTRLTLFSVGVRK